jgi:hypothetical protein
MSLSSACDQALLNPLPPPPFSTGRYFRRHLSGNLTSQTLLIPVYCLVSLLIVAQLALISFITMSSRDSWLRVILRAVLHALESGERDEECIVGTSDTSPLIVLGIQDHYTPLTVPEIRKRPALRHRKEPAEGFDSNYPTCAATPLQTQALLDSYATSHSYSPINVWIEGVDQNIYERMFPRSQNGVMDDAPLERINRLFSDDYRRHASLSHEYGIESQLNQVLKEIDAAFPKLHIE